MNRQFAVNTLRRGVFALLFFLMVAPAAAQDGAWPRTLTDGLGNTVTIAAPPQRIVSLSLAVDEVLLSLIEPERLRAVTALSQDPGISNVPLQALAVEETIPAADAELILSLEPDLVFAASFTNSEIVQQLKDAGVTVFVTGFPIGFEPIREAVLQIGAVVGTEAGAAALVAEMDAQIAAVAAAVAAVDEPVRALYLTPGNFTTGVDASIAQVIEAAGGMDVAAAAGIEQFAAVSDEFIVEQNPDVIFLSGWTPFDPTFIDLFRENPAFEGLRALENGRVFIANDAHLTTVSHFIAEGVEDVAAYLYPDLFPAPPFTVTDAAGREITLEARPRRVGSLTPESDLALSLVLDQLDDRLPFEVVLSPDFPPGDDAAFDVIFSTTERAAGAVMLHRGESPAARVANLQLIGDALGTRTAAQDAIAFFTDNIEAAQAE